MWQSHCTQAQSTASHYRLTSPTGEWLRMRSKVSCDCLPSYIKATWPVFEIFKMAGYFPDGPRILSHCTECGNVTYVSEEKHCLVCWLRDVNWKDILQKCQLRDLPDSNVATAGDRLHKKALSEGIDIYRKFCRIVRSLIFKNAVTKNQISWDVTLRLLAENFSTFRSAVLS